ncbi:hypothetical protein JZ751_009463 [Albula glossodonta]|uniref:Ion transport domain-containing protein n=1 Tax=Albula glossodonta TaxID=121402 RepID=A0A8T2NVD2_9TELE|nr:hypothetical protein JZ751_009463 [Albula glossodonta]
MEMKRKMGMWNLGMSRNFVKSEPPFDDMAPPLARSAPGELNHWWGQLRFRLQNRKGINDTPLFFAAKENDVGSIRKLLKCPSTNIFERGALGETALHVAALSDNLEAALIIRGADVATPRVTGLYFRKRRGGLMYYGEHILSFACCVGNEEIICMLIDAGANIRAQDYLGNTALHILVLQPNKTIACQTLDLLLARDSEMDLSVPLDMLPNYRGLTTFKLAAKEGNVVVFQHLVNRRRIVQWSLGPLTSSLYDLTEIDSWADDLSARRMLDVTPVRQLVSLKWNLYGKHYFSYVSYEDHLRLIPDILRVGAKRYFGQTALGGPFHVILITYACLVVLLCVLRASGMPGETVLMAVSLVLGWCNVMYFARGFQMLGPYVIMIQKIIFGDLTKFIWLSIIVLIGFSTALWMVYMTQDPEALPPYRSFPITLFSQFELSVGLVDLPVDHSLITPPIVHVLHCSFSVVSYILLLNLLIAMMSDTHWRVAQERDELWRTQVVATTLMLERRLPRCLWPRLGVCGLLYGLGECWYLRVEDRNDQSVQKIRRYVEAFSKEDDPVQDGEETEKTDTSHGPAPLTPLLRRLERSRSNAKRKSLRGWQVIRRSTLGLEPEMESHPDKQEVEFV